MQKLSFDAFRNWALNGSVIIDTRQPQIFSEGFIEESISIPFNENFSIALQEYAGEEQGILIVGEEDEIEKIDAAVRLLGLAVHGYLEGGYPAWVKDSGPIDMLITIEADEFAMDYQFDEFYLVDARTAEEFGKERVEHAENIPLIDIEPIIAELDTTDSYYVYGNSAAQAVTAGSIFKRYGFNRLRVVSTGFDEIKATDIPIFSEKKKGKPAPKLPEGGASPN